MKTNRLRKLFGLGMALYGIGACAAGPLSAQPADAWPPKITTIVIGFGAGSSADLLVRILADGLQRNTGGTFIVENKPGAGGNISVDTVVRGPADGSVVLDAVAAPIIINPMMMTVNYDPFKDLQPVTVVGTTPNVLVANKKLGLTSIAQLQDAMKKSSAGLTYSSVGPGTISHLTVEVLAEQVGAKMVHVPFRSSPDALNAVMQGDVDISAMVVGSVEAQIQTNDVSALAITSSQRWPSLPNVPTVAEAGIKGMPVDSWNGLFLPASVPKAIVDRFYQAVKQVITDPAYEKRIMGTFFRPSGMPPEAFAKLLRSEVQVWRPVLAKVNLLK